MSLLHLSSSMLNSNIATGVKRGGLYVEGLTTVALRRVSIIKNYANNQQGHQIVTYNSSKGIPSLTVVNTNFTHTSSTGNFYGYQENIGGSPDKFIPPQTCASNPCTVFPFTGTCTNRTGNLGVLCDYDEATTCPANEYKQFVSVENGLPPSTAICATTKPEWDCAASKGVFKRTEDCYMSGQVVLTGDLNIMGRENVYTKLVAAPNSRHFLLDGHRLTVMVVEFMTGGNAFDNSYDMLWMWGLHILSLAKTAGIKMECMAMCWRQSVLTMYRDNSLGGGAIYSILGPSITETIVNLWKLASCRWYLL